MHNVAFCFCFFFCFVFCFLFCFCFFVFFLFNTVVFLLINGHLCLVPSLISQEKRVRKSRRKHFHPSHQRRVLALKNKRETTGDESEDL